jgi:hypothetical protein
MQSQAMCLETNLAGSSLITDRTQGLNAVIIVTYISSFVGFVVYESNLILNVFSQLQVSQYWNIS